MITIPPDADIRFECFPKYARLILGVESRCEDGVDMIVHDLRSVETLNSEGRVVTLVQTTLEVRRRPREPERARTTLQRLIARLRRIMEVITGHDAPA